MNNFNIPHGLKICIVTGPLQARSGSYYTIINNFLKIVSPIVDEVVFITGNFSDELEPNQKIKVHDINMLPRDRHDIISKTLYSITSELKISFYLIKLYKCFDGPVFILSGTLLLPTITARLLKKISVLTAVASDSNIARRVHDNVPVHKRYYYYFSIRMLELFSFKAANYISVESPHVARFMHLPPQKVLGNGHLFFLDDNLKQTHMLVNRPNSIGYVGRLSQEKGIKNFVTALPKILSVQPDLHILIIGDGPLSGKIKTFLEENTLETRVSLLGWIPHDDLPKYLNQLRLLVLPSYTEGLPNIMLEAMACGTPVLASPVGAIPDIINDEETGFIMENNSPERIAENVLHALNFPELDKIAENGRRFVKEHFTFEKTVENWKRILQCTD